MRRSVWLIVACLTLAAACGPARSSAARPSTSAAAGAAPAKKAAAAPLAFSFDFLPTGNQAPYYVAAERGFYARQGLDVHIVPGVNAAESTGWLATGKVQITEDTASVAAKYITKGASLRVIAVTVQKNPFGLLYRKATPVLKPTDLYGLTVGVPPGTEAAADWNAFVSLTHLQVSRVRVVNVAPAAQLGLLHEGKVDAVATSVFGPAVLAKPMGIPSGFLPFSAYGDDVLANCIVTTTGFLKAHPGEARRFLAATAEGFAYARQHPNAAAAVMHDQVPKTNAKALAAQLRASLALAHTKDTTGKPWGWQASRDWQAQLSMMQRFMGLKHPLAESDYFTNAYLPGTSKAS